ncbi:MAG: hypothetical protein J0L81_16220 [Caulobacterales bacterium]|nr:hypothetical protein [Caulobacterales bacterium]
MTDLFSGARVRIASYPESAGPGMIFVGTAPNGLSLGVNPVAGGACLVVSPKVAGANLRSASGAVADFGSAGTWLQQLHAQFSPERPFDGLEIVAEDASPDTCLALVMLARGARGQATPSSWRVAADMWELGRTNAADPYTHWGSLHSALAHSEFGAETSQDDLLGAISLGGRFVERLIEVGKDPDHIAVEATDVDETASLIERARAHLRSEQEAADRIGDFAEVVELSLEVTGGRRRRLVDAVFLTEEQSLTGAMKTFLRSSKHSPSGRGFAFIGLHRPGYSNTGNDITFSVDPARGVWLRDVWEGLERAESNAWRTAGRPRPAATPRDLRSYTRPNDDYSTALPADITPVDNPWYDGAPIYTILGAPRGGAMLSWRAASELAWRTGAPSNDYDFRSRTGQHVDLIAGTIADSRAALAGLDDFWLVQITPGPNMSRNSAFWTPTLARIVAAFTHEGSAPLFGLPRASDLDTVRGQGGAVVIAERGAALVDLTHHSPFPKQEAIATIEKAAHLLALARRLEQQLEGIRAESAKLVASGSGKARANAIASLYAVIAEATDAAGRHPPRSPQRLLAELEQKLETRWNAHARLQAVIHGARELRDMVSTATEVRSNEMLHSISIYGFPFALLVNMFAFAFAGEESVLRGFVWHGIEYGAIAAWLVSGAALALLISAFIFLRDMNWRALVRKNLKARKKS